jgi:hypothetical protein
MRKLKLWMLQNYLEMFWSILKVRLGFRYSEEPIPSGLYCYELTEKLPDGLGWKIKTCPYYTPLKEGSNGCKFTGIITDDLVFDDSCKICGVKTPNYDEPLLNDAENL